MTIGYVLMRTANAFTLCGDTPQPSCPECDMVTDRETIDPGSKPGSTDLDASYSYDGYLIGVRHHPR